MDPASCLVSAILRHSSSYPDSPGAFHREASYPILTVRNGQEIPPHESEQDVVLVQVFLEAPVGAGRTKNQGVYQRPMGLYRGMRLFYGIRWLHKLSNVFDR
jgi:hypothetical protein